MATAASSALCGSNSSAASPATSAGADAAAHVTGRPRRMASSIGSPKPSTKEGNAKQAVAE